MIEAKQNKMYLGFISWYSRMRMKWHFNSIRIDGELKTTEFLFHDVRGGIEKTHVS